MAFFDSFELNLNGVAGMLLALLCHIGKDLRS